VVINDKRGEVIPKDKQRGRETKDSKIKKEGGQLKFEAHK
jgi:hypothetical protein